MSSSGFIVENDKMGREHVHSRDPCLQQRSVFTVEIHLYCRHSRSQQTSTSTVEIRVHSRERAMSTVAQNLPGILPWSQVYFLLFGQVGQECSVHFQQKATFSEKKVSSGHLPGQSMTSYLCVGPGHLLGQGMTSYLCLHGSCSQAGNHSGFMASHYQSTRPCQLPAHMAGEVSSRAGSMLPVSSWQSGKGGPSKKVFFCFVLLFLQV